MAKPPLDHESWKVIKQRLAELKPDDRPEWGSLTVPALLEHFNATILLTLNELPGIEDGSNWFVRTFLGPVFHRLPLPRNVKAPPQFLPPPSTTDLDTLLANLDVNVQRFLEAAEQTPNRIGISPVFGPIKLWQWSIVHRTHFYHHMKQFGLTEQTAL